MHVSPPLTLADPEGYLQAPVDVLPVPEGPLHLVAGSVSTLVQPEDQVGAQVRPPKDVICRQAGTATVSVQSGQRGNHMENPSVTAW